MDFFSAMVNVMLGVLMMVGTAARWSHRGCADRRRVLVVGRCLEMICRKIRLEWSSIGRAQC